MLSSVEQAFVGREEIRAPLKTPAWEASFDHLSLEAYAKPSAGRWSKSVLKFDRCRPPP